MTNAPMTLPEGCLFPGQVRVEAGEGMDLNAIRERYCDVAGCALRMVCQLYAEPSQYTGERATYLLPCHELIKSVNSGVTDKVFMYEEVRKPELGEKCEKCLLNQAGLVTKAVSVVSRDAEGEAALTCEVTDNRNGKISRVRGFNIRFRPSMLMFTNQGEG